MAKISVLDKEVAVYVQNDEDYICLTDMAKYKDPERTELYNTELDAQQDNN